MASNHSDPLRFGYDEDMEDLTAQLESALLASTHAAANGTGGGAGRHSLDLGDDPPLQGNLDRFKVLADSDDDLGGHAGSRSAAGTGLAGQHHYPSYGQLATQLPPSYEDSIMYENVHASYGAGAGAGVAQGGMAAAGPGSAAGPPGMAAGTADLLGGPLGDMAPASGSGGPLGFGPVPSGSATGMTTTGFNPFGASYDAVGPSGINGSAGGAGGAAGAGASINPFGAGTGPSGPSRAEYRVSSSGGAGAGFGGGGAGPSGSGAGGALTSPRSSGSVGGSLLPPRRAQLPPGALTITVTDPVKKETGGLFGLKGGYVSYLVTSTCNGASHTTRRRFKDFVALADLLKAKYRGYFIPPRPEKNAVEGQRMTDTFVEDRRGALERYLNRLARHPVLSSCEELRVFLQEVCPGDSGLADSAVWAALQPLARGGVLGGTARFSKQLLGLDRSVLDPVQAVQPTKKTADFMRAIKETAHSMQSGSSSALPDGEVKLRQEKESLEGLKEVLGVASRSAEKLVACLDSKGTVLGDMGLAMFKVSKFEESEGQSMAQHTGTMRASGLWLTDVRRLANAAVRDCRGIRKAAGRAAWELGTLHDYLAMMPAAIKGLRGREKQLLTADTLASEGEARRKALAELEASGTKTLGGEAARLRKIDELRMDVSTLDLSLQAARAEYDKIKAINMQELGRMQSDLRQDLTSMLHRLGAVMAASSERSVEVWLQVSGELGASASELHAAKAGLGAPGAPPLVSDLVGQMSSSIAADLQEGPGEKNPFAAPL